MERLTTLGSIKCLRFSPWERVPGLCQGVTVRSRESESTGFFSHLVEEFAGRGFSSTCRLKQVHGRRVVPATGGRIQGQGSLPVQGRLPEADGLVGSSDCNVVGAITMADCVPVFLLDTASCGWALLHAGWRGIAAGILPQGVRALIENPDIHPDKLEMYLGPAACGSCYQVGPEVAARFERYAAEAESSAVNNVEEKKYFDLRRILAFQARSAGIPSASIHISRYCTHCDNHLFYSYRIEGKRSLSRMWAFLGNVSSHY